MQESVSVLLSEEELDDKIREMGAQISRDYAGRQVHLICVLKGGTFFMCELAKRISIPVLLANSSI
jgi:hypoxanthine phosphoribosyltransferase